jgi:hypothetical protein
MISDDFVSQISNSSSISKSTNHQQKKQRIEGNQTPKQHKLKEITQEEVWLFLAFIVDVCANQIQDLWDHLEESPHIKIRTYRNVRENLSFDVVQLVETFNQSSNSTIDVCGDVSLDEQIWEWFGDSGFLAFIPRKPHSTGLKVMALSTSLQSSQRPVCVSILPDNVNPRFTANESLQVFFSNDHWFFLFKLTKTKQWASKALENRCVSITADAWFGNLNWLRNFKSIPTTFSVSSNQFKFLPLFSSGLKFHEFREFSDGEVIVSVWNDHAIVVSASNAWSVPDSSPQKRMGTDFLHHFSKLSEDALNNLKIWGLDDLQKLSEWLALPISGSTNVLAHRISRHPVDFEEIVLETSDDALKKQLEKLTKAQLKDLLQRKYHVTSSGKKEKLIIKLMRLESDPVKRKKGDIKQFLEKTCTTLRDEKPKISTHYAHTFNNVDKFNRLMGFVNFKPRISNDNMLFLTGMINIALVNSWVLFVDSKSLLISEQEEEWKLKRAVKKLSRDLWQHLNSKFK